MRENLRSYDEDPGWYEHPEGTVASQVGDRHAAAAPPFKPRPILASLQGLAPGTVFQAIKANSCASMAMSRR